RTAELEASETALRAADRKKDEFLATLAHELRNPLAPLRFGLDILAKHQSAVAPIVPKTLAAMDRQLTHVVRLVDDLLDMARISQGTIELKKEYVALADVVEIAVEMSRPHLQQHGHTLTVEASSSLFTHGDPTRLAQIVGNLLHNAAKFTPAGGAINVEFAHDGDCGVIRVIDRGEGIAPEKLEDAFAMFARIDRGGTTRGQGLGIGLALGRRLAELHGGTLTGFSDGMGRGATFTLRLPAVAQPAAVARVEREPEGATTSLDIVVIEDIDDVAETLAACLEEMGHRVSVALTGARGIELIHDKRPDVVLCDLGLPEMDGIEVCRRIRSSSLAPQPVMIALTGWGRPEDLQRTREAGFEQHLVKPVAIERLESALSSVMKSKVA
ncbi:MAG: response regulator, partial [Myxococcales bacterium]|nr:response regulator [Myxococcales bacterium]